jgi:hypothetical protein
MLCGGPAPKVDSLPKDSADTAENRRIDFIGHHTVASEIGLPP